MRTKLALIVAIAIAGSAESASAQTSASDQALSEALFREGQTLLAQGKTEAACGKLAESERLDPKLGTLLNLATCHEQLGLFTSAWAEFNEASVQATRAHRPDRITFANEHAAALEKRLSHLTVTIASAPANLEVKLDGKALGVAALGTAMPLDPGSHSIEVRAPGKAPWTKAITVVASADQSVQIPALEDEHAAPPAPMPATASVAAPAPQSSSPPPPVADHEDHPGSTQRTAGLVVGGIGVAGVVVGAIFGARTLSKESAANATCPNVHCPDQASYDLHQQASSSATVSTIAFGVGLAALAGSAVLLLTAPSSKSKSSARVFVTASPTRIELGAHF